MTQPKLLIAITTCHVMNYYIDDNTTDYWEAIRAKDPRARRMACRDTWIKDIPEGIDYKFFYGTRLRQQVDKYNKKIPLPKLPDPLEDEVYLDCGDAYLDNSEKVQTMCKWALEHGYDYLVRIDDDTYIYPERLLATDWQHPYAGAVNGAAEDSRAYHPGGCLFLSKDAMKIIVASQVTHWADDLWIGRVMRSHNIPMHEIPSVHLPFGQEYICDPKKLAVDHQYSAVHSCFPAVMKELYEREE